LNKIRKRSTDKTRNRWKAGTAFTSITRSRKMKKELEENEYDDNYSFENCGNG
jgi:hypothetical protein